MNCNFNSFNNFFFNLQIFRHGDRTPSKAEIYPKLPHNPIYDTLGYGQLTQVSTMKCNDCNWILYYYNFILFMKKYSLCR